MSVLVVLVKSRITGVAALDSPRTKVIALFRLPQFLPSLLFSFQQAALIPQLLAVAHLDPRVPREAPVPARRRVLVGAVGAVEVAVRVLGSGGERRVVVVDSVD